MSNAHLIVHAGGVRRTRDELATLATPEGTGTWKPVPHWELVSSLHEGLSGHGIAVSREQYATSGRGDARLFGVLDLLIPGLATPDYGMSIGIRGSNDKSLAIQAVAGARVFVCDNMAFAGDSGTIVLHRKHTSRLDLAEVVPPAIDTYLEKAELFRLDLDRMKDGALSDAMAKELIFDAFARKPILPRMLFPIIAGLYFDDEEQRARFPDRTLWSLNNSFTEAVKILKPAPQASGQLKIGRYFGKVLRRSAGSQVALPAPVVVVEPAEDPFARAEAEDADWLNRGTL
jgi:hypothetical protein